MPDLYAQKPRRNLPMKGRDNGGSEKKKGDKKKGGGAGNAGFLVDPLTPRSFRRERRAETNLQTRPLARQLKSEKAASLYREQQEIPAWYQDYRNVLQGNAQASQGAYQQALGSVGDLSLQLAQQDNAGREAAMARMQADAQLRGTTVNPNVEAGAIDAAASRDRLSTSLYGTIAGQGANQQSYLQNRQGIAAQQGIAARQEEGARRRKITEDQRALAREKGDLRAKYRTTARESERKYLLENKALGSKNRYSQAIENVAALGVKEKGTPSTHTNINVGGSKDSGGITRGEAWGMARSGKPKKGWKSQAAIYEYLTGKRSVPGHIAKKVAAQIWKRSHGGSDVPNPGYGGR